LKERLIELGLQRRIRAVAGRGRICGGAAVVGVAELGEQQRLAGLRREVFEILNRRLVADHRIGAGIGRRSRRTEPAVDEGLQRRVRRIRQRHVAVDAFVIELAPEAGR